LGEVCREYKGRPESDGLPVVGLEHLSQSDIDLLGWSYDETTFTKGFRKGHVLFGRRRAYLKKASVAPFDGVCSGDIIVIEAIEDRLLPDLLPFVIQNDYLFDFAVENSAGSLSPRVKWKDLSRFEFDLPSMEKQKELAELLRAAQETKRVYSRLITACDEIIKSRFIEMFGDPASNPYELPIERLSKLGVLERGKSKHRPRNAPELRGGPGGPYPLVQTGDITNSGLYLATYEDTYTELGLQQSRMWPKGTLCITIAANIAQTAILAIDACFPDSVVGFTPGERVSNVFLHYWFSFFQGILEEQAPQAAQKNINLKILSDLGIITPPIDRQNEFEAFVAQVDKSELCDEMAVAA